MASLTVIAKKAGVSVTTASLVLNKQGHGTRVSEECAARIRGIAEELGYVPNYHASSIKKGRSESVAIAMDLGIVDEADQSIRTRLELDMPYFGQLVGAIEAALRAKGYLVTLVGPDIHDRAPDRAMIGIRQRRFDGMIVLGSVVKPEGTAVLEEAPAYPIVVVQPSIPTQLPTITYDEVSAITLMVDHLAGLGHQRLLWVGQEGGCVAPKRRASFAAVCHRRGVRGDVMTFPIPCTCGQTDYQYVPDIARDAMAGHLAKGPREFTGVVCYNDNTAIGVVDALVEAGVRVPEDVSVIGHDNFEGRRCRPRLTSVDHCLVEMGRRAADSLLSMIDDPSRVAELRGTREVVEPQLVIRNSTGPAPR